MIDGHIEGSSELLEAVKAQIDALPDPTVGDRNVIHLRLHDGSVAVKSATWINAETGEKIEDPPFWMQMFPRTTEMMQADYVANLPDAEEVCRTSALLKNPVTGTVSEKYVPWMSSAEADHRSPDGTYILSEYKAGVIASRGRQFAFRHNPTQQFDDPTDETNLRFWKNKAEPFERISWIARRPFRETLERREPDQLVRVEYASGAKTYRVSRRPESLPDINTFFIGINLGGTIVMEETEDGLTPKQDLKAVYDQQLANQYKNCSFASISFPLTKLDKDAIPSEGMDSSQMKIDFLSDTAMQMVQAWNSFTPEEREGFGGFIMSIGSDTAVESLTIFKMILGPDCPFSVIGVASMKPMGTGSTDGPENFRQGIAFAEEMRKRGLASIALSVNGGIYDPTKTIKTKDNVAAAFAGAKLVDLSSFETIEQVAKDHPERFYARKPSDFQGNYEGILAMRGASKVKMLTARVSEDIFELEREIRDSSKDAFIIEVYGSLTLGADVQQTLKKAANGRPIFCVNSVFEGQVEHGYGPTLLLKKYGINPLAMTSHTARAKLNYAIRLFGNNRQRIIDFMTKNDFVGEQRDGFSPYEAQAREAESVLRDKVYEAIGITTEMVKRFEDPAYAITQFQISVRSKMSGKAVSRSNEAQLFMVYSWLKRLNNGDIIEAIKSDQAGLRGLMSEIDSTLVANILNYSTSTVRPKGHPIELKRFEVPCAA